MKTLFALILGAALALACTLAPAEPAPWYKWRSKLDGTLACSQTPLGPGWDRATGPYRDSRCTRLVAKK